MITPEQRQELRTSEVYWTARAMQEQGSRFYRALGDALHAADAMNRTLILDTWPDACWDFYQRGLRLRAAEGEG
ncbi:hypothetical protein [Deinococcus sp. JMULE3]|uniref:hypothetical protein n=1 Tax=Deinococcus sp. JMULE3 TaxID=2518341 RepID=UPI001575FB11|nr:hypothetical protein [Deinococcus sp. JMULE3]NTX99370.1 hypothetical protein [Deinococcus sp. JMULE3]